jgi:hypothetical protein
MSERNGDRSRFQRLRKAGVRRRARARVTHATMKAQAAAAHAAAAPEPEGELRGQTSHLRLVDSASPERDSSM